MRKIRFTSYAISSILKNNEDTILKWFRIWAHSLNMKYPRTFFFLLCWNKGSMKEKLDLIKKWNCTIKCSSFFIQNISHLERGGEQELLGLTLLKSNCEQRVHAFLPCSKTCKQQNRVWMSFITCLQDRTKKFGCMIDYWWKFLKVHF